MHTYGATEPQRLLFHGVPAGTYTIYITDANGVEKNSKVTITEPTVLSASASTMDVSCNGGSDGTVDLTVTGGTAPYTYAWSNTATTEDMIGLTAGTYSVTVTDANGCTATELVTVSEPTAIGIATSTTDVSSNGGNDGKVTTTVTGGTAPYTYAWNNTANTKDLTGVTAGTYAVTVTDANGCTATKSVEVKEPAALEIKTNIDRNVSCNGGSDGKATANVNGGTAPYAYLWSNGASTAIISGVPAGTYTIYITDANGVEKNSTVTITEPTVLSASASTMDVSCNGGSDGTVDLTVTGGTAPYTYAWSNTATTEDMIGLTAGTYSVTVTDANGCTATELVTVSEPTAIGIATSTTDVSSNGGNDGKVTTTVTGGTAPYTYAWNNTANTKDLTGVTAGTYAVTVTDANGCTATKSVEVKEPAALEIKTNIDRNVSCNGGSDGKATANVNGGTAPYAYLWSNGASTAIISGVPAGTYTIYITDANGVEKNSKVTITEPTVLTASASATDVSCNGGNDGTVDLTVTGGIAPYSLCLE